MNRTYNAFVFGGTMNFDSVELYQMKEFIKSIEGQKVVLTISLNKELSTKDAGEIYKDFKQELDVQGKAVGGAIKYDNEKDKDAINNHIAVFEGAVLNVMVSTIN